MHKIKRKMNKNKEHGKVNRKRKKERGTEQYKKKQKINKNNKY